MPRQPPWSRPRPAKKPRRLTPEQRQAAEESARQAGRRYPNLIDNMRVLNRARAGEPLTTSPDDPG